ncbi:MAG TPA: DUF6790 family protein [Steroidobacteraceae bacterium]
MYVPMVTALMLVLPIVSSILETYLSNHGVYSLGIFFKWFVFFPVGLRLLLAGARQIFQPRYTAEQILGIKSGDALIVVRELGIANLAIGTVGTYSIFNPDWVMPAGLAGAIFYGLAGINHLLHKPRTRNQSAAMVSDLFVAIVLAILLLPS